MKDLKSDIIRVEVDDRGAEIRMSSLVDTVSVIPLDNAELIGSIDELVWAENRILILDRSKTKKVFIYDRKGSFINSITSGEGEPGSFVFPASLTLSVNGDSFFVISGRTKRILEYDLDGNLINDFDVKSLGHLDDLYPFVDGFAIKTRSGNEESIVFTDLNFNKIDVIRSSDFFEEPPFINGGGYNYFYSTEERERFYYKDILSNKIFEIKNRKVNQIYDIDLPDSHEVDYQKVGRSLEKVSDAIKKNELLGLGNNHVTFGDFMLMDVQRARVGQLAIWNIQENKMKFISNVVNDLSILINVNAIWGPSNNASGKMITAVEGALMTQLLENVDYSSSPYAPVFDNLTVATDDNPVLIVYHLKKDYKWPFD
ncbi:6-bladed beta-propeller [Algoriphagus sp.]|uniref:6-bladed beta-propeller n=1 Tax=Algoriphagus sp. TaxID=1872435 RepID=UPI00391A91B6